MREKILVCLCLATMVPLLLAQKPALSYSYVAADYSCQQSGKQVYITAFSQVFAVCYQETNHRNVGNDARRSADQAAQSRCSSGPVTFTGLRQGIPYQGTGSEQHAARDLASDINSMIRLGNSTANFFISAPYSGKCQ